MPPKRPAAKKAAPSKHADAAAGTPVVLNESLLATDTERSHTSKSMYGDHKARVSSNVYALSDNVKNSAFMSVLKRCAKGKSVLHLGCGIGLWAMTAARAEASSVVAVDTSAIVDSARVVAQMNNFGDKITFLHGKVRDGSAKLPREKFDIILCDWVGAMCTNDALYREFMFCAENHLAEGGILCPNVTSLNVAAINDYQYYQDTVHFWDNVYGFTMKPMQPLVTSEPTTGAIPKGHFATTVCKVAQWNAAEVLARAEAKALVVPSGSTTFPAEDAAYTPLATLSGPFRLNVQRKATLHFLTFFVDCGFVNPKDKESNFNIGFTLGGRNSWSEVSAFLPEPIPVFAGDAVEGTVTVVPKGTHTELTLHVTCKNVLVDHNSTSVHRFQY